MRDSNQINRGGFDKNKKCTIMCIFHLCYSSWLGIRDGNITFEDSLDFDISEIESVYEDAEENQ